MKYTLKPSRAISIIWGSVVNRFDMVSGRVSVRIQPEVVMHRPHIIPFRRVSFTRFQLSAPILYPSMGCMPWVTPNTIITKNMVVRFMMP